MPTGISPLAPSATALHEKDLPAFTILQKDGLDSNLPILHINGYDNGYEDRLKSTKLENAKNDLYSRKRISKSNDHLVLASLQSNQINPLKKLNSKSYGNLRDDEKYQTKAPMSLSTEDFNEVLNAKLRRIQEQEDDSRKGLKRSPMHRKPFITTVKTGEFLMPPPEVAALLGIAPSLVNGDHDENDFPPRSRFRPLASLNRKPEVRHNSHNSRCHAALKATVDFSLGLLNSTIGGDKADRSKRSTTDQPVPFGNIMFDRRVARGNTYASAPTLVDCEQSLAARQAEARRRQLARKRAQTQSSKSLLSRLGSPPPVAGRKHEPVQTETYLEELLEKPDESEAATQTDYFLDRPATPIYCPVKVGQDVCTQIEPGELFDYDVEVQPILEVLVGKTIEQAMTEVLEEEELASLREQQRRFMELRAAEKVEQQRLEEQDRRLREEQNRIAKEHEDVVQAQQETEDRVAATVLLTGYIAELLPAVLENLKMSGFLLDEIKADVEEGFMPWLMKEVKKEVGNVIESRELLMEIIQEILENRADTYRRLGEEYDASRGVDASKEDVTDEKQQLDDSIMNYEGSVTGEA